MSERIPIELDKGVNILYEHNSERICEELALPIARLQAFYVGDMLAVWGL
ncbi:MAG: hypothetical protein GY941_23965 [Planctomycetes bacterium]|nr:hypothetical protein [Planctomycetota bacterium]